MKHEYKIRRLDRFVILYEDTEVKVEYSIEAQADGVSVAIYKDDTITIAGKMSNPELIFKRVINHLKEIYKIIKVV